MPNSPVIPDWKLERFVLGELPEVEMATLREIVANTPDLAARIAEIERSNEEILSDYTPKRTAAAIRYRASQAEASSPKLFSARRLSVAAGVAVVAIVAIVSVLFSDVIAPPQNVHPDIRNEAGETIFLKGMKPYLTVYRQSGGKPERLESGASAGQGDVLQVAYIAAKIPYGVVISIDGRGAVTRHLPPSGGKAAQLSLDGELALPNAYQLDDAPDFERFFFVTSQDPFLVELVERAAKKLVESGEAKTGMLNLPESFLQAHFLLVK